MPTRGGAGRHGGADPDRAEHTRRKVRDGRPWRDRAGGGAVSVERIVGLLVAVALVGLLVAGVKFPDRF
ncbi:hypothetical protein GZL_08785 [Streptomyces sp. 769]|nr:hypothetical protein GZL_08785 [Streptomyces sp. 769]